MLHLEEGMCHKHRDNQDQNSGHQCGRDLLWHPLLQPIVAPAELLTECAAGCAAANRHAGVCRGVLYRAVAPIAHISLAMNMITAVMK